MAARHTAMVESAWEEVIAFASELQAEFVRLGKEGTEGT